MKKNLNIKAFWTIISGLVLACAMRVFSTMDAKNSDFERLAERRELSERAIEILRKLSFGFNVLFTIVFLMFFLYFVFRLIDNKKNTAKQGYISFLFIICIILVIFNLLSVIGGNWIKLINLTANGLIVAGTFIQRNTSIE